MSRSTPLSALLRQHRLNSDLTLEGLAERAGVSDRAIGDIERGVSLAPQRHTVAALADALALDDSDRADFVEAARAGRRLQPSRAMDFEATASLRPHSLPDFTGRDGSLALVMEVIGFADGAECRGAPVVISGAAGVGKTTLAIEVSRRGRSAGYRELFLDLQGSARSR
jgi:transcriptional regulator with XRE-family HTH domain